MPPARSLPESVTSLTDQELADQLREYNVPLGPILPSTRRVYERKLFELQTGERAAPTTNYDSVDDDEEDEEEEEANEDSTDEEVILQQQQPRQRTTQSSRPEASRTPPRKTVASSPVSASTSARRPQTTQSHSESAAPASKASKATKGGLPFWVKLLVILIIATLIFLVFKNMESDPASELPEQIHVSV